MSNTRIPPDAQRRPAFVCCARCWGPLPTGFTKRPVYCSFACKQAAYRARKRQRNVTQQPTYRPAENNEPTAKSEKFSPTKSKAAALRISGVSVAAPINLIGHTHRWPGAHLDPDLARKVLTAELGPPGVPIVSSGGVAISVLGPSGLCWRLSTGAAVPAVIALQVVTNRHVVDSGDRLFGSMPAQTYRYRH